MAIRYYANSARAALVIAVGTGNTTITLTSTAGFPVQFPYTVIIDQREATEEVVEVTSASGNTLTVTRGADGTTAFSHAAGATVGVGFSARDLREPNTHINSTNNVHGVTGNLVGTSDTQALTNKDLSNATNTFPSTLATTTGVQSLSNKDLSSPTNIMPSNVLTDDNVATVTNKDFSSPSNTFPVAGSGLPSGVIVAWPGIAPPGGWLLCDGAAVDRTEHAAIFAVIGTTYGDGDGSSTFNLPDMRVRIPIGAGTGKGLAATEGFGETVRNSLYSHSHSHSASSFSSSGFAGDHSHSVSESSAGSHSHSASGSTSTAGSHNHSGQTGGPGITTDRAAGNFQAAHQNHSHSFTTTSNGSHSHSVFVNTGFESSHSHNVGVGSGGGHSHSVSTSTSVNSGGSPEHPFIALNYIIKT